MERMRVEVVSPSRKVMDGEAEFVLAPAIQGEVGVLPRHTPFLSPLGVGVLRVKSGSFEQSLFVSGGYIEVSENVVSILAQTAERSDEIDIQRAKKAKERAEERIARLEADVDLDRARASLLRAISRLKASGHLSD